MQLNILIFAIIIALTLTGTYFYEAKITNKNIPTEVSKNSVSYDPMPDFTLTALDTKTLDSISFDSKSLKGKVVLLNFWASWCGPCLEEFPRLLELAQTNHEDLILLAISTDHHTTPIKRFFKKMNKTSKERLTLNNVIIGHDIGKKVSHDLFQAIKMPETIIISPAGNMIDKVIGAEWTMQDMQNKIEQARNDNAPIEGS